MNTRLLLISVALVFGVTRLAALPVRAASELTPKTEGDEVQEARTFHILVRTKPESERAKRQIHGESRESLLESFMQVARRTSIDPSSSPLGGDLGMVREGEMVKEFERAVYSAALHEVSEPIQSPFGWHLILVMERGLKPVKTICSEGLSESLSKSAGRERSALEFSSRAKSAPELHPGVLEFMEPGWGPPLKDAEGNLGYLRATPGRTAEVRAVVWHTEYVRPLYNPHPQGCSRSARREIEVRCSDRTAAVMRFQQFEGRAASGRVLKNYPTKKPEHERARAGTVIEQIVRTACD
jgi:hypothetical protein